MNDLYSSEDSGDEKQVSRSPPASPSSRNSESNQSSPNESDNEQQSRKSEKSASEASDQEQRNSEPSSPQSPQQSEGSDDEREEGSRSERVQQGSDSDNQSAVHSDAENSERNVSEHSDAEVGSPSEAENERESDRDEKSGESDNDAPVNRQPISSDEQEHSDKEEAVSERRQSSGESAQESEAESKGSPHSDDSKSSISRRQMLKRRKSSSEKADSDSDVEIKRTKRRISRGSKEGSDNDSDQQNKRKLSDDEPQDSDSDPAVKKKKRTYLDDSDEGSEVGEKPALYVSDEGSGAENKETQEEDKVEGTAATAQDLFGEDIDISSDDEGQKDDKKLDESGSEKAKSPKPQEPAEPDEPPAEETRIEVELPRIWTNRKLGKEMHFIKLPNFLSVDTRPYDPQWYEDEIDEDEVLDEEGRARLKLKVENTMRWRKAYDDDGNQVNESNTRIIKWSDGSLSLHLGSEIFDVYRQSLMPGDHNHLFIRQGTGLQGQAVFRTKLTFRPHSTDSFTHRKMTLSLADRNQKTQKIRVLPNVGKDPEAHRSEMIKKEEDRLKASIRRESKQRRMKEKPHSRGLSASYLEPDRDDEDDDGAISLAAIKNKYKKGAQALKDRSAIYSSDEGSEDEAKAKRLEQAKEDDADDDSDLDYFDRKKASNEGRKKTVAIEESEDDDD